MPSTSTRPPLDALLPDYARHAKRMPVSEATVRSYVGAVAGFVAWLAEQTKHDYDEVVTDPMVATHAVRDYRRHLLTVRKLKPKSVDAALTGISSLYSWLGMPRPDVPLAAGKRRGDPHSLAEEQAREVLRAAERRGVRDHAIVMLLYAAGARAAEAAALDVDDLPLSDRKGLVLIRSGKGDKPREVPLNGQAAQVLGKWTRLRRTDYGMPADSGPLFVTRNGQRLSVRSLFYVVQMCGQKAGVEISPHTLRHTFGTRLARSGVDMPVVADLMGHADVNTTMIYARSTGRDRDSAVEHLTIDY